jgi:hypothetical protein
MVAPLTLVLASLDLITTDCQSPRVVTRPLLGRVLINQGRLAVGQCPLLLQ